MFCFHTHVLPHETLIGFKSKELLDSEWHAMSVDVSGKEVLDIGSWDGYFSFRAESEGANRIVAMDHYVWSIDLNVQQEYWKSCLALGVEPVRYDRMPSMWKPTILPGKAVFDYVHAAKRSRVEQIVADFMTVDATDIGNFDVVFFLGVIYHMQDPIGAMKRVSLLTRERAIIETEAIYVHGHESRPMFEFFPGAELNGDVTNWFVPNISALRGLCQASGFKDFKVTSGPPSTWKNEMRDGELRRYRLTGHALK